MSPMRSRSSKTFILLAALAGVLFLASCGAGKNGSSEGVSSGGASTTTEATQDSSVAAGGPAVAALSGARKAEGAATGWEKDAKLYAIASVKPKVDETGRAPGWLYTYVSASEGAVASVSVSDGKAKLIPEQSLPEDQIKDISNHALPPPADLLDSTEAVRKSGEFRKVLEKNKGLPASAGLDSFSTGKPVWIFSTAQGDKRVEERVTATTGS